MKLIDYQDSRPIYEQIVENLKIQMYKGILRADEQLPSVRSLAIELSTNPNTVQRAYTELERQGFIYTVKGKGNFVRGNTSMIDNKKEELIRAIIAIFDEAIDIGIPVEDLVAEIKARIDNTRGMNKGRLV